MFIKVIIDKNNSYYANEIYIRQIKKIFMIKINK